jgi:pimeloyl-ACP methyl ester carboxylesterase
MDNDLPILLLPGMDGTGRLLQDLADRLAPRREVTVVAYPTTGPQTYKALTAYALEQAPADGRYVVLGESFSGPIAVEIAYREPTRVAGLILASTFVTKPADGWLSSLMGLIDITWVPQPMVDAMMLGSYASREVTALFHEVIRSVPGSVLQARSAASSGIDCREHLRQVACPLLSLQGKHDMLLGHRMEAIAETRPDCEVRRFDCAHMLLETNTAEAAAAIEAFCEGLVEDEDMAGVESPA